jgi:hypothetical protein
MRTAAQDDNRRHTLTRGEAGADVKGCPTEAVRANAPLSHAMEMYGQGGDGRIYKPPVGLCMLEYKEQEY